jgi:hypothetical protein
MEAFCVLGEEEKSFLGKTTKKKALRGSMAQLKSFMQNATPNNSDRLARH